ncbi:MAG: CAP domain-containing protein [Gammaproteobacteria bacterium]
MHTPTRWRLSVAALSTALLLGACGGGNDKAPAAASAIPAANAPGAPAATGNIASDGLAWINYRRTQIGMQAMTRNPTIDLAAQGHSDYQKTNNKVTHDQTIGLPGFTGVTNVERLKAAGYQFGQGGYAGEVISASSSASGFFMAEELITAIYHRFAIFEPRFREIGTGAATNSSGYAYFTADFTIPNGAVTGLGKGVMAVWPGNGQTLVPVNFLSDNETPDPIPTRDVNEVGYPISVHADLGASVKVDSFTVRPRGGNSDLAVKLLAPGADAHTPDSAAAIIPLAVLRAGTTYEVSFRGSVDGLAVNKTWSFTTK